MKSDDPPASHERLKPSRQTTHAAATHTAIALKEDAAPVTALTKRADPLLVLRVLELLDKDDGRGGRWSRNSIAKAMAVNSSYVVTWLQQYDDKGVPNLSAPKLTMDLARFEASVEEFLGVITERREFASDIVDTAFARDLRGFINAVRSVHGIGVYISPGGDGKTCGIEHYRRANPMTLALCATTWCCTQERLLAELFTLANRAGRWPRNTPRVQWLIDRLNGSERVIIIDSYHRLSRPAFAFLFDLHDKTAVPLVLVGNASGLDRISGDSQLFSRVCMKREGTYGLPGHTRECDCTGCKRERRTNLREAVDSVLARDIPQHAAELKSLALQVAEKEGCLRALVKHLRLADELLKKDRSGALTATDAFMQAHGNVVHSGYVLTA